MRRKEKEKTGKIKSRDLLFVCETFSRLLIFFNISLKTSSTLYFMCITYSTHAQDSIYLFLNIFFFYFSRCSCQHLSLTVRDLNSIPFLCFCLNIFSGRFLCMFCLEMFLWLVSILENCWQLPTYGSQTKPCQTKSCQTKPYQTKLCQTKPS